MHLGFPRGNLFCACFTTLFGRTSQPHANPNNISSILIIFTGYIALLRIVQGI